MQHRLTLWLAALTLAAVPLICAAASPPEPTAFYIHIAEPGDTVYDLSHKYLRRPGDWEKLRRLNRIERPRQMPVGTVVRIPVAWMRSVPASANVVVIQGQATSGAMPLQAGSQVREGADVRTADDGYVTLQLPDGSELRVQSQTHVQLDRLQSYAGTDMHDATLGLRSGRVEARAKEQRGPAARFVIRTPSAAAGVRGTDFRVGIQPDTMATHSEVLSGVVDVSAAGEARGQAVAAGFGMVLAPNEKPSAPTRLLEAPDLSTLPALQQRVTFRIALPPVASAASYRTRVASDAGFHQVMGDVQSPMPAAVFSNLPDGDYWLSARAIDSRGLEGIDAVHTFRLKARPEPPLIREPQDKGITRSSNTTFAWTVPLGIDQFHFQLARDIEFQDVVRDERLAQDTRVIDDLQPAEYYWRIASIKPDGDHGPFSDPRRFSRRPSPSTPEPRETDDRTITISWSGEPGQTFLVQIARDAAFASVLDTATVSEPQVTRPKPEPGTYFVRTQATDPDGFVGPFSAAQQFTVLPPESPKWWLLLLVPLLFAL